MWKPLKGTPSTHIPKPNSTAEGYPHSVINETFRSSSLSHLWG